MYIFIKKKKKKRENKILSFFLAEEKLKKTVLGRISSTQKATLYVSSAVSNKLLQANSQGQNAEERL